MKTVQIVDHPVTLRFSLPADESFEYKVYASTRLGEMALVSWWNQQEKEAFLKMQFNAQRQHYKTYYHHAEYSIIMVGNISIGRMIVDRSLTPILLIDIALLLEYRGRGIGTQLLKDLLAEASRVDTSVMLHVESFNPAMRLYERLGFIKTGTQGIYEEMTWFPASTHPAQTGAKME